MLINLINIMLENKKHVMRCSKHPEKILSQRCNMLTFVQYVDAIKRFCVQSMTNFSVFNIIVKKHSQLIGLFKTYYKVGSNVLTWCDSSLAKDCCKLEPGGCHKVGQVLQSGTEVFTKWDRCYKVR